MTEPFYIAQTFEPEHVESVEAKRKWFRSRFEEANKQDKDFRMFWRLTFSDDGLGLLLECWSERPDDQGAPRWSLATTP